MELARPQSAAEVDSRGDVPPLVAAADLQPAVEGVGEVHEIPGLEEHVAELGVGQPAIAFEPALHRIFGDHL